MHYLEVGAKLGFEEESLMVKAAEEESWVLRFEEETPLKLASEPESLLLRNEDQGLLLAFEEITD